MRHSGPAVILFALITACAESGTEPLLKEVAPDGETHAHILEASEEYPEGLPPELRVPAILHSIIVDVGWSPDGFAYSGAQIEYTATNAYVASKVMTDLGSSELQVKRASHLVPVRASLQTAIPIFRMPECRGTIRGYGIGSVWNQFLVGTSLLRWGDQEESGSAAHQCPRTTTKTTTTTSGEGADDGLTCYTIETDHYWYYPDTGELEYRYTEAYSWCEKDGTAYM